MLRCLHLPGTHMDTQPFKSLSMQQLEEAFAAAVSALTNTKTKVMISMIKDVGDHFTPMSGKEEFALEIAVSVGVSYRSTPDFPTESDENIGN